MIDIEPFRARLLAAEFRVHHMVDNYEMYQRFRKGFDDMYAEMTREWKRKYYISSRVPFLYLTN